MPSSDHSRKLKQLYLDQKHTLDIFLENGAITRAQYDKSLGDLTRKMGMGPQIRKAVMADLDAVEHLYDEIHDAEEAGRITTGWKRGIYPSRRSALAALERDDLFVLEDDDRIAGCAVINQIQVDVYAGAPWRFDVPDNRVCVLHTLVISPSLRGKGYGRAFLAFYESYAASRGCPELRIDTNEKNTAARAMYQKHGYREIGIVPTVFNGIPGVNLVLLEKNLDE